MANVFAQFVDDAPKENVFAQFVDELKDTPPKEQAADKGGFIKAAKSVAGSTLAGTGRGLKDVGLDTVGDLALEKGKEIQDNNKPAINSLGDIADHPGKWASESVGQMAGQAGAALAAGTVGAYIGGGLGVLAGPFAPVAVPALAAAGGYIGGNLPMLAQEYGSEREQQLAKRIDDKGRALEGAVATTAIENLGGFKPGGMAGAGKQIVSDLAGKSVKEGAKILAKKSLQSGLSEAAEEIPQQYTGAYGAGTDIQDLNTKENAQDAAFGAAMAIPSGAMFGSGNTLLNHYKSDQAEKLAELKRQQDLADTASTGTLGTALANGGIANTDTAPDTSTEESQPSRQVGDLAAPTGISQLTEFKDLLANMKQEKADEIRTIVKEQGLRKAIEVAKQESQLETLNNTLAYADAEKSQAERMGILDNILQDEAIPSTEHKGAAFSAELGRQGYNNTDLTDLEKNRLETHSNLLNQAQAEDADRLPSLANEHDFYRDNPQDNGRTEPPLPTTDHRSDAERAGTPTGASDSTPTTGLNHDQSTSTPALQEQSQQASGPSDQSLDSQVSNEVSEIAPEESPYVKVTDNNGKAFQVLQADLDSDKEALPKHSIITGKRLPTPILRQDIASENTTGQVEVPKSGDVVNPSPSPAVDESNDQVTKAVSQPLSSQATTPHEIAAKNTQTQLPNKIFDNAIKSLGGLSVRGFVADNVSEATQFSEDGGKFYIGDTDGKQQVTKAVHAYGKAYQAHLNTAIEADSNTDVNILARAKAAINSEHITPYQKESLDDGINHIENGGNVSGGFAILRRDLPPTEEFISNETKAANDTQQSSPVPVDNATVTRGNEITPTVGKTGPDVSAQEVAPKAEDFNSANEYHAAKLKFNIENSLQPTADQEKLNQLNKKVAAAQKINDAKLKSGGAVPMGIQMDAYRNANNRLLSLIAERDAHAEAIKQPSNTQATETVDKLPETGDLASDDQTNKNSLPDDFTFTEDQIKNQKTNVRILANAIEKNKVNGDVNLKDKVDAIEKHKVAENRLRKMRLTVFTADDAAHQVAETGDISHFEEHKDLFPDANKALAELVSNYKAPTQQSPESSQAIANVDTTNSAYKEYRDLHDTLSPILESLYKQQKDNGRIGDARVDSQVSKLEKQLKDAEQEYIKSVDEKKPDATNSDMADLKAQMGQAKGDAATGNYGKSNKVFTESAADKARALLKSKLGQLNSGLDPEIVQAGITLAGYHIEAGARDFSSYTKAMIDDLGEAIKPYLRSFYESVRHYPTFDNKGMTSSASIDNGEKEHAPSPNTYLESNSQNTGTQDLDVSGSVQDERPAANESAGTARGRSTQSGVKLDAHSSDTANPAALDREPSDQQVHSTEQPTLSTELPTGVADSERSGNVSNGGIQARLEADPAVKALVEQRNEAPATSRTVTPADAGSIAATLPILNHGQQADVLFAEKRLAGHKGVLFTNGTGTGKTYSALGIIKRLALQGKTNIMIVVPSVDIANQWVVAANRHFDLAITRLKNTRLSGKGVVIATYANFGMNKSLPSREWDLVVTDESHKLLMNEDGTATDALNTLRGITYHDRGFYAWFNAKYAKEVAELNIARTDYKTTRADDVPDAVKNKADKHYEKMQDKYNKTLDSAKEEFAKLKTSKSPKVVFLSATPFAYIKTVDYAEGYLFHYGNGRDSGGYNSGNDQDHFFMNHFGYRMRYNKLTRPDAKVDTGLMERQFNATLRKSGALSFRSLDVNFDYDRKFVLVDSVMGRRIDEAFDWIRVQKYDLLSDLLKDKFDYLQRRFMLEALKARESVNIVGEHLALGRKVLVFHDYKKGGVKNPFIFNMTIDPELNAQISAFNTKFTDVVHEFDVLPSPIELFKHAFGDGVMIYNGSVSGSDRAKIIKQFNEDDSGKNLILVQSASAKEGVSFHDTTGKHQRVLINLGLPTQPTTAIQQEGRIYRVGQQSDALFRYLNTGTSWERWAFATTIAQRASTAENLAAGEGARALKQSFVDAFQDSDTYPAGFEGEGKGGKSIDQAAASAITEFDRAKTYYFGQGKKTSRNKSAEGKDYFATPEPVGWLMAQLADARTGDSMLEPSAGHGAIARFFRDDAKTTAIEPSGELSSRLAMVFDGEVKRINFEDLDIHNKYNTIVMNPPFGVGGKVAIEHLDKATKHLPMNGRVVALIPEGGTADKRFDKWIYGDDKGAKGVEGLYLVANISLPTCTFERAGTQVKTRIVVIDRASNDDAKNIHSRNIDLSNTSDINELFNRIEDLTVQPRNVTEQKEEAPKQTANTSANATGDKYITDEPETTYTTKKGKVLHGVIAKNIDLAEAQKFDKYAWKRDGGIFIRMDNIARPDGYAPLFSRHSDKGSVAGGVSLSDMENIIDRVGARYPVHINRNTVFVVPRFDDLPRAIQEEAEKQGYNDQDTNDRITGVNYQGKIYIVQSNIRSKEEVEENLLHEHIHQILHGDKSDPQGIKLSAELNKLYTQMGGIGAINTLAEGLGINLTTVRKQALKIPRGPKRILYIMDEFLAEAEGRRAYEKLPQKIQRALREFYGFLRSWLRDNGYHNIVKNTRVNIDGFTPSDLAYLLHKIRNQDSYAGTGSNSIQFNRVNDNNSEPFSRSTPTNTPAPKSMAGLADQARQFIANHTDSSKTFNWWHNTIGTQAHKATVDSHFKKVFEASMAMEESTAKFANAAADMAQSLLPKLEGLKSVSNEIIKAQGWKRNKDAKAIGQAIFQTTLDDKPLTEAELVAQGYSPKQRTMYHEFFAAINKSMDDLAKSEMLREAKALSLVPANESLSLKDTASFYADQVDDDPNIGKSFINKAEQIKKLQDQGYAPLMRFGQYTLDVNETLADGTEKRLFFGLFESQAEANEMGAAMQSEYPEATIAKGIMSQQDWQLFKGITPETMEVFAKLMNVDKDAAFQEYLKSAVNNRSALKRLIHRKKMPGFAADPQRVLASFITSNAKACAKNIHLGDMVKAITDIPKAKGDVLDEAVNLYNYVQNPTEKGAAIRGLLFTWYLGGSVASAMVNLTQTLTTTTPYLHQFGETQQVARIMAKAMKLAALKSGAISGDLGKALKLAGEEGVTEPQELHMLYGESMRTGIIQSQLLRPLTKAWGSLFSLAESYNRRVAFIAAYTLAKETNKPDAFAFAAKAVNDTQFIYNKSARPNWARSTVGSMVFTFKTFSINYLEFLKQLPPKERLIALGILIVLSGLSGLPGDDDADDIIDSIGQGLGYNTNTKSWKQSALSDMVGKTAANYMLHGVSAGLPVDLSQRLGAGNLIPGSALFKRSETNKTRDIAEFVGPVGGLLTKGMDAFDAAQTRQGLGNKLSAIGKAIVPKAMSDAWQGLDMLQSGQYKDVRGKKIVNTDATDALFKAIGLQPSSVAEQRRAERYLTQDVQLTKSVESDIAGLWAQGLNEKDQDKVKEAGALLKDWNDKNPDTPIRISHSQIVRRVKQMRLSSRDRLLKTAPKEMRRYANQLLANEE